MVYELQRQRQGRDQWETKEIVISMDPQEFETLSRDKAQKWSFWDTNRKCRITISKITFDLKDPSDPEILIMKSLQAQRLAFLQSPATPHVTEYENWRKPGTRRVVKAPAPCRQFGKR